MPLVVRPSPIHSVGVYTSTPIRKGARVVEYTGPRITPEEADKWKRGASNAGYHYLGCAKTFALMGKAFAEANLQMMNSQNR